MLPHIGFWNNKEEDPAPEGLSILLTPSNFQTVIDNDGPPNYWIDQDLSDGQANNALCINTTPSLLTISGGYIQGEWIDFANTMPNAGFPLALTHAGERDFTVATECEFDGIGTHQDRVILWAMTFMDGSGFMAAIQFRTGPDRFVLLTSLSDSVFYVSGSITPNLPYEISADVYIDSGVLKADVYINGSLEVNLVSTTSIREIDYIDVLGATGALMGPGTGITFKTKGASLITTT